MISVLVPCPSCARHLRIAEKRCPFCGKEQAPRGERASRLSAMAVSASIVMTAAGVAAQPAEPDEVTSASDFATRHATVTSDAMPRPLMVQYGAPPMPPEEPEPEPDAPSAKPPPARGPVAGGGTGRANSD